MKSLSIITTVILLAFGFSSQLTKANSTTPDVADFKSVYEPLDDSSLVRQAVHGDVLAQHELGTRLALGKGLSLIHI